MIATDKFWKFFWLGAGGATLVGILISLSLFALSTRQGNLVAAVGASFDASKDPFQSPLMTGGTPEAPTTQLYTNALPAQFRSWTWEARVDWRSSEKKNEGSYVLKADFIAPGGTIGMNGPTIDVKDFQSITLSVWVDQNVGDLTINIYDKNGISLGAQSLAWYTPTGELSANAWQEIVVPLKNFTTGSYKTGVSGFSISGKNPGVAYLDSVELSKISSDHPVWVAPPEPDGTPFNPFATSTPAALPYQFEASAESLRSWYTYFGRFELSEGAVRMGPSATAPTTGSMTVLRGGRNWSDYEVTTTLNWGAVSVFSLLGRFVDDGNFASCAFSRYGETVQLYHVKDGKSTFISQTPALSVPDYEPWVGVKVGMKVRGDRVSCFLRGDEVLGATIAGLAGAGTAGFETWDSNSQAAPHTLRAYEVRAVTGE